MHLITMAHLGEAQAIIASYNLKRLEENLFQGEDLLLLLTGEGPFEASSWTAYVLGRFPIKKVINLGIAGSLSDDLHLGEIYPVRTHYLVQEGKPFFKTFTGNDKGVDAITSFERILNPEKAQVLKGMGHLVDREAWGVAQASKIAGVPFQSFKLISDQAGSLGACEVIKEEAQVFAQKLEGFLQTLLSQKEISEKESMELKGFYFTFTMGHRFDDLLTKFSIKKEKTKEEALSSLPLDEWLSRKLPPKERARLLMDFLEHELDPTKKFLQQQKEEWLKGIKKNGIDVQTDPEWEHDRVSFRFEASHDEDLKQKLKALQDFSLGPYHALLEGHFHVE